MCETSAFVLQGTRCAACWDADGFRSSVIRRRPESKFQSLLFMDVAIELYTRALLAGVEGVGFRRGEEFSKKTQERRSLLFSS
jgi:hypothetical protein